MFSGNINNLYIKKRTFPQILTGYIFLMPFLFALFMDVLGFSTFIKYTVDIAWFLVFAILFLKRYWVFKKDLIPCVIFLGIFIGYTLLIYLFNYQSILYYVWGLRNNFRFYIAFLAFATFFDEEDACSCFKVIEILFWINALVTIVQFFFFGYQQDFLGGIFGVEKGCNASTVIFLSIVVSKSILLFMNGKEKILACFFKCAISLLISAMAELKIFFVFFLIILIYSTIITKFSFKKFLLIFIAALLFFLFSSVLVYIFGENSTISLVKIIESITAKNYSSGEDIGRFTAIPTISKTVLTDLHDKLFGMGLGNCETSTFEIFNTPFYKSNMNLHYSWLSSAFLFLETGYIGLVCYISFFAWIFVYAYKQIHVGCNNLLFVQLAMLFSILSVLLMLYNSSLRMEAGYMVYFVLALPFLDSKKQVNVNCL